MRTLSDLAVIALTETIDAPLLVLMPIGIALSMLFYVGFSIQMRHQDSRTPLGKWIIIMYVLMAIKNLFLVILFGRFAWLWWDIDLSAWVLFMVPLDIFSMATAVAAWRVMHWNRVMDHMLDDQHKQQMQDKQV